MASLAEGAAAGAPPAANGADAAVSGGAIQQLGGNAGVGGAAGAPGGAIHIDVPEATILGETFTAYTVVVAAPGGAVARVLKRYSTLSALSDALRAAHPRAWAALPPFPPKKFFGNNRDVAFVAGRREALEAWFAAVSRSGPLRASPALRAALRANDPDCEVHEATMRLGPSPPPPGGAMMTQAAGRNNR